MGLWRNLVAQLLCMQKVMGSNPVLSTKEIHTALHSWVRIKMNLDYFDDRCPIGKGPSFAKYCLVAELVNALHC